MGNDGKLTAKQFQEAAGLEDWRALAFGASAWFAAESHASGAELIRRVADLADLAGGTGTSGNHLPQMDLRAGGVHVRVGTSGSRGFAPADVEMARSVSALAENLGLAADPSAVQTVQLAIDTLDKESVMPFWQTILDYEQLGDDALVDPMRRDPSLWFQAQDRPRPLRNRIHLDVSRSRAVIREEAEAAAAAAGGHATYEGEYYATFADVEGNEVDLVPEDEVGGGAATQDWRALFGAMTFYPVAAPRQAAELAAAVAGLADAAGLPLLVDIRSEGVTIDTGKDQWEDERFEDLAQRVQAAARGLGLTADTSRLRFVQIGIDAVDVPTVRAFWRALLGYEYDQRPGVTDIYDPRRLNLPIFFQQMPASELARRNQRNRIHVDVFVPDDQARARIDAALAAGGRIVYDDEAPEWWTVADPEGNEVDIAVSAGREELWLQAQPGTG
jgi:pterin-4a-carbinolamine dehydratase